MAEDSKPSHHEPKKYAAGSPGAIKPLCSLALGGTATGCGKSCGRRKKHTSDAKARTHFLKVCVRTSVVPLRTCSTFPLFPALKRRAISGCPSGAGFSSLLFHRIAPQRVLTHTLKPCATQNQSFPQAVKPCPSLSRRRWSFLRNLLQGTRTGNPTLAQRTRKDGAPAE